jgi:hypothetical protein
MDAFDVFAAADQAAPSVPPLLPAKGRGVRSLVLAFLNEHLAQTRDDLLSVGEEALAEKLGCAHARLEAEPPEPATVDALAAAVEEDCWSRLTGSGWAHVCLREAFVVSKLLRAAASALADALSTRGALGHLDVAFILGGPSTVVRDCIQLCSPAVSEPRSSAAGEHGRERQRIADPPAMPVLSFPIERCCDAADPEPLRARFRHNTPFVLQDAMHSWRALDRWADLEWLRAEFGDRIVPVELGRLRSHPPVAEHGIHGTGKASAPPIRPADAPGTTLSPTHASAGDASPGITFGQSESGNCNVLPERETSRGQSKAGTSGGEQGACGGWSERLLPLREMIDLFLVDGAAGGVGYLAQHPLFDQLHALCADFSVPSICSFGKLQHINAWLGPGGTVTPLHFDSYDNVLAQVQTMARSRNCRALPTCPLSSPLRLLAAKRALAAPSPSLSVRFHTPALEPRLAMHTGARTW